MPPSSLHIAIIGAGTAGAAAGLLLARAGHKVAVFEAVAAPGPVGAGILLQPTGQAVLARLGLRDEVVARGHRVDHLLCETSRGRKVLDLSYAALGDGHHGYGLHRGALFAALFRALQDQAGVGLHLGVEIRALVTTPKGRLLRDAAGNDHGPFDLTVVADGAGSDLRDDQRISRVVRPYPWGALWWVAPDPDRQFRGRLHQIVEGAQTMLGLLPTGTAPDRPDVPLVSLFWSIRADRVDAFRQGDLGAWKARVSQLLPAAAAVVASIDSADQLLFARYRDVVMPVWHGDRTVWLGDAAHAMSPQLGQGANLALCDAAALADCVAAHPDVKAALSAYTRTRRRHLDYYQWATRALTPFFQSDSRLLPWLRDLGMPLAGALPWSRRKMVAAMAGAETGLLLAAPLDLSQVPQLEA